MKATNRPRESKKSSVLPLPKIRELFPQKKDVQIIRKKKQPIFAQKRIKEQAQEVVMFDVL